MSGEHDEDPHELEHEHADAIVRAAAARGLGTSPLLRGVASVGWSAFLGASLALIVLLLLPEGWLDQPVTFGRLGLLFAYLWILAVVPALSAALLARTRGDDANGR